MGTMLRPVYLFFTVPFLPLAIKWILYQNGLSQKFYIETDVWFLHLKQGNSKTALSMLSYINLLTVWQEVLHEIVIPR